MLCCTRPSFLRTALLSLLSLTALLFRIFLHSLAYVGVMLGTVDTTLLARRCCAYLSFMLVTGGTSLPCLAYVGFMFDTEGTTLLSRRCCA